MMLAHVTYLRYIVAAAVDWFFEQLIYVEAYKVQNVTIRNQSASFSFRMPNI